MAQQSGQRIVGHDLVKVVHLDTHQNLQNISGDNCPAPSWTCDYVTYCYLRAPPSNAEAVARKLGATLHTQSIYVDTTTDYEVTLF